MKQFAITYLVALVLYFVAKPYLFDEAFYDVFCMWLANVTAQFVWLFDDTMFMEGPILRVLGGSGVWVTKECAALDYSWMLCGAVLAYPSAITLRLAAAIAAVILVQTINIGRLFSIYFVQKWYPEHFDLIHLDIWPIIFAVAIVFTFLSWVAFLESKQSETPLTE